jgi:hypothetical protein
MILQAKCKHCSSKIRFFTLVSDRLELSEYKKKSKLELKCRKCGVSDKYEINSIFAETKLIQLLSLAIILGGTALILIFIWDYLWKGGSIYAPLTGIIIIPSLIYLTLNKSIESNKRRFNSTKI